MRRSSGPRKTANLSESVGQQLNMYALAASAAGVGLLALASPSEAKIVYTPTHINIAPNHVVLLDLNHDGTNDFIVRNVLRTVGLFRSDRLSILPQDGNEIWGHKSTAGGHYASALVAGIKLGPSGAFSAGSRSMAFGGDYNGSSYCLGKWTNVQKRYLGLKFAIHGKTHFGWARLNVHCDLYKIYAVLTGYAYETIPNKSITTGKTKGPADDFGPGASLTSPIPDTPQAASLGALAMGAPGLSIWRRKEPVGGTQ